MPPALARLPPELQPLLPLAAAAVCGAAFAAAALWLWRRRAPPSADDPPIVLVVRIRVAPGRRAAFLKLWSAYAAYVARSETGVLSYAAAAAEASPDELVLLQRCVPGGRTRQLARRRRRRWEHRRATFSAARAPPAPLQLRLARSARRAPAQRCLSRFRAARQGGRFHYGQGGRGVHRARAELLLTEGLRRRLLLEARSACWGRKNGAVCLYVCVCVCVCVCVFVCAQRRRMRVCRACLHAVRAFSCSSVGV